MSAVTVQINSECTAEIVRNKSIRLYGTRWANTSNSCAFDRTFNVGDQAEYDSYNLSYYGEIVSITEKSVTIREKYSDRKRRLKLDIFFWRNYNFNLAETQEKNAETSYYI